MPNSSSARDKELNAHVAKLRYTLGVMQKKYIKSNNKVGLQIAEQFEHESLKDFWGHLGMQGGCVMPFMGKLTAAQCFAKELEHPLSNEPQYFSMVWYHLGKAGGGVVNGTTYRANQCFTKVVEISPADANGWMTLATQGGGTVNGVPRSVQDCYLQFLELANAEQMTYSAETWFWLGSNAFSDNDFQLVVRGRSYTKKDCFVEALEVNSLPSDHELKSHPDMEASMWLNLGDAGGGIINGKSYSKMECYAKSAGLYTDNSARHAWARLDIGGGNVIVNGKMMSQKECEAKHTECVEADLADGGTNSRNTLASYWAVQENERKQRKSFTASSSSAPTAAGSDPPDQSDEQRRIEGARHLAQAALDGNAELVRRLLAAGADHTWAVGAHLDAAGATALSLAATRGHTQVVRQLLAAGANVSVRMKPEDATPMMLAAEGGHLEALQELIAAGSDVDARSASRDTALMSSASTGHTATVKALLAAGADPRLFGDKGSTALYEATVNQHIDVVKALLDGGADPNPPPEQIYDVTPLSSAVMWGNTAIVEALLGAGADPARGTAKGHSALYWAVQGGHRDIYNLLRRHGATGIDTAEMKLAEQDFFTKHGESEWLRWFHDADDDDDDDDDDAEEENFLEKQLFPGNTGKKTEKGEVEGVDGDPSRFFTSVEHSSTLSSTSLTLTSSLRTRRAFPFVSRPQRRQNTATATAATSLRPQDVGIHYHYHNYRDSVAKTTTSTSLSPRRALFSPSVTEATTTSTAVPPRLLPGVMMMMMILFPLFVVVVVAVVLYKRKKEKRVQVKNKSREQRGSPCALSRDCSRL